MVSYNLSKNTHFNVIHLSYSYVTEAGYLNINLISALLLDYSSVTNIWLKAIRISNMQVILGNSYHHITRQFSKAGIYFLCLFPKNWSKVVFLNIIIGIKKSFGIFWLLWEKLCTKHVWGNKIILDMFPALKKKSIWTKGYGVLYTDNDYMKYIGNSQARKIFKWNIWYLIS